VCTVALVEGLTDTFSFPKRSGDSKANPRTEKSNTMPIKTDGSTPIRKSMKPKIKQEPRIIIDMTVPGSKESPPISVDVTPPVMDIAHVNMETNTISNKEETKGLSITTSPLSTTRLTKNKPNPAESAITKFKKRPVFSWAKKYCEKYKMPKNKRRKIEKKCKLSL